MFYIESWYIVWQILKLFIDISRFGELTCGCETKKETVGGVVMSEFMGPCLYSRASSQDDFLGRLPL